MLPLLTLLALLVLVDRLFTATVMYKLLLLMFCIYFEKKSFKASDGSLASIRRRLTVSSARERRTDNALRSVSATLLSCKNTSETLSSLLHWPACCDWYALLAEIASRLESRIPSTLGTIITQQRQSKLHGHTILCASIPWPLVKR